MPDGPPPSTDSPPGPSSLIPNSPKSQVPFPLLTTIPDPQHVHSIPLILDCFSATSVDGTRFYGYHDFLPSLFEEAPENSCLVLSADIFARAYFVNQSNSAANDKELARLYGKTLRSIREALCYSSERQYDASIAAVWLLGNYEVRDFFGTRTRTDLTYHADPRGLPSELSCFCARCLAHSLTRTCESPSF